MARKRYGGGGRGGGGGNSNSNKRRGKGGGSGGGGNHHRNNNNNNRGGGGGGGGNPFDRVSQSGSPGGGFHQQQQQQHQHQQWSSGGWGRERNDRQPRRPQHADNIFQESHRGGRGRGRGRGRHSHNDGRYQQWGKSRGGPVYLSEDAVAHSIESEMEPVLYPFSCFTVDALIQHEGSVMVLEDADVSPEQWRWEFYKALRQGTLQQCEANFQRMYTEAVQRRSQDPRVLAKDVMHRVQQRKAEQEGMKNSIFGGANIAQPQQQQQNSIFGRMSGMAQPQPNAIFGQGSTTQQAQQQQQNSIFGGANVAQQAQQQQQQPFNAFGGGGGGQMASQPMQSNMFQGARKPPEIQHPSPTAQPPPSSTPASNAKQKENPLQGIVVQPALSHEQECILRGELTEASIQAYTSDRFTFGQIPEIAPTGPRFV